MAGTRERTYTAAVVIIGNEVLSGRVCDANLQFLASRLKALGLRVRDCRVIPDVESTIVSVVNELRELHDYVFTTGGIGPTHDDITAECIARAFGVEIERNPEAVRRLERYARGTLDEARLRMANVPRGASLLDNPVSFAPGFRMENVFVLPGVPRIMREMFEAFSGDLEPGPALHAKTVHAFVSESAAADPLRAIQDDHPEVELGSYPYLRGGRFGTALVARTLDAEALDTVTGKLVELVRSLGESPEVADGEIPMEFEE